MTLSVPQRTGRRWYRHGWNRPMSWELILRITPKLPRFLLVPLHHVTTLVCFACMRSERRAARRNLMRVTGLHGFAATRLCYRLFLNFSRYLVAYADLRHSRPEHLERRLLDADVTENRVAQLLAEGRGVMLATMHIGHWDLGLKLLERFDVPVHVVMMRTDPPEITRYAAEARSWARLRVHPMGESPRLAIDLVSALRRGEIVAVQIDRAVGGHGMKVPLFGAPAELPTGPAHVALTAGAPVLPVFVLLDRGDRYRVVSLPPLTLQRGTRGTELVTAMASLARVMEQVISRYPDQWFNFYDVWPRDTDGKHG